MTALYIHRKLDKVHLTGSCYPHISEVENLPFAVNQHKLIGSEDLVVIGVGNVSVWKPYAFNISGSQCKRCVDTVSQTFINPFLAKVDKHFEFLKKKMFEVLHRGEQTCFKSRNKLRQVQSEWVQAGISAVLGRGQTHWSHMLAWVGNHWGVGHSLNYWPSDYCTMLLMVTGTARHWLRHKNTQTTTKCQHNEIIAVRVRRDTCHIWFFDLTERFYCHAYVYNFRIACKRRAPICHPKLTNVPSNCKSINPLIYPPFMYVILYNVGAHGVWEMQCIVIFNQRSRD